MSDFMFNVDFIYSPIFSRAHEEKISFVCSSNIFEVISGQSKSCLHVDVHVLLPEKVWNLHADNIS